MRRHDCSSTSGIHLRICVVKDKVVCLFVGGRRWCICCICRGWIVDVCLVATRSHARVHADISVIIRHRHHHRKIGSEEKQRIVTMSNTITYQME